MLLVVQLLLLLYVVLLMRLRLRMLALCRCPLLLVSGERRSELFCAAATGCSSQPALKPSLYVILGRGGVESLSLRRHRIDTVT